MQCHSCFSTTNYYTIPYTAHRYTMPTGTQFRTMPTVTQFRTMLTGRDLFHFWVHSALPQKLSRRFTFVSFGGDIKLLVPGNPLKISLSAIGSFLVSWVISSKPIYKKKSVVRYIWLWTLHTLWRHFLCSCFLSWAIILFHNDVIHVIEMYQAFHLPCFVY